MYSRFKTRLSNLSPSSIIDFYGVAVSSCSKMSGKLHSYTKKIICK